MSDISVEPNVETKVETRVETQIKPGLTWRSALALTFSLALVQPAMMYGMLVTGVYGLGLGGGWWPWIVILLWAEITRFLGQPLTKQELFIILSFQSMSGLYAYFFIGPIYNMYIAYSAESQFLGVAQYVPSWWVPSARDAVRIMASQYVFLDPAWIIPIGVTLLSVVFTLMSMISVGYFTYAIYVQQQKLEFPVATAQAETILSLAVREPKQMRILMLAALFGIVYNTFVSFLPYVLGPYLSSGGLDVYAQSSPIAGVYDMTTYLANVLPGAGMIFSLDIGNLIAGFLISIPVAFYMFAGSIAFYFFGSQIITRMKLWPAECLWNPSWTYYTLEDRSYIYFYASIQIGLGLAAIAAPIIIHWRSFIGSFRGFGKVGGGGGGGGKGGSSRGLYVILLIFVGSSMASVIMVNFLTGFPIWILTIFTLGGSLLSAFLSAAASGVTVGGLSVPFLSQLMIYYSGWQDKAIWFAAPSFSTFGGGIIQMDTGGAGIAISFKQADLLGASKAEYLRTFIVLVALGILSSFLFTTFLWTLSPIPSGAYPNTINYWPLGAAYWARWQKWVWTGFLFRRELILGFAVVGAAMYAVSDLVFHQASFLISFLAGSTPASYGGYGLSGTTSLLLGAIVANTVIKRSVEKGNPGYFGTFRGRFVIGFTVGYGFMSTLRVLLVLISRSMWLLPF